jgi:choline dehydrogenase-like flavoprotein
MMERIANMFWMDNGSIRQYLLLRFAHLATSHKGNARHKSNPTIMPDMPLRPDTPRTIPRFLGVHAAHDRGQLRSGLA